jgi:hypothetical protein
MPRVAVDRDGDHLADGAADPAQHRGAEHDLVARAGRLAAEQGSATPAASARSHPMAGTIWPLIATVPWLPTLQLDTPRLCLPAAASAEA